MKDKEVDTHLRQHLSGDSPGGAFKQYVLSKSMAEFVRVRRRRSVWRGAGLAAAAILIVGIAFLGGRLSAPRTLPSSTDISPRAAVEPAGVRVPNDLVAWLDAARLFERLGMEDRMSRAVERAGKLLPYKAVAEIDMTEQATTSCSNGQELFQEQNKHSILAEILTPRESVESVSRMIAESFGGYYNENRID